MKEQRTRGTKLWERDCPRLCSGGLVREYWSGMRERSALSNRNKIVNIRTIDAGLELACKRG